MGYLTKKETEFYEWLDQCPVHWFQVSENEEFVTYNFTLLDTDTELNDVQNTN